MYIFILYSILDNLQTEARKNEKERFSVLTEKLKSDFETQMDRERKIYEKEVFICVYNKYLFF
jgi:hypothetical protein